MAKERTIKFVDNYGELLINTNAPKGTILKAIQHRNIVLVTEEYPLSDFEIIQNYIWDKGYDFEQLPKEDCEEYDW